ncbi:DNA photolyase [Donghicola sp. C2-DW-16]|uniref:DNA photolyase n=1 Tax=Donghicola mangrovi TaxID=2729614 RepID=A0ABX2PF51_9RHOB|nr:FAD-binding domain-containing protein [Donghicola mangrovi]NVO27689.1 DNA photolyase [Donghicola mangrovi]
MPLPDQLFLPTRAASLGHLRDFVPLAGQAYGARRNYDLGAGRHGENVSCLSPYIRHRLITETEVLEAVLTRHSPKAADKFIQEVFWRTYWKGWLEMRPAVWQAYRAELGWQLDRLKTESGLRRVWQDACAGQTGIAPFDHWAKELAQTGYLHNHARMWFASIWVFTLGLPWTLGADFFMRHLLDGDPASNTLSWRWVAGLQTRGKAYVATASNIETYTEGRFSGVTGLADSAHIPEGPDNPAPIALPDLAPLGDGPTALLVHSDDLGLGDLTRAVPEPLGTAILGDIGHRSPLEMSPHVQAFVDGAVQDTLTRWADKLGPVSRMVPEGVADWAASLGARQVATLYAPVGPVADDLAAINQALKAKGIPLIRLRNPYDSRAWPHATNGFFRFKEKIPALLGAMRGFEVV